MQNPAECCHRQDQEGWRPPGGSARNASDSRPSCASNATNLTVLGRRSCDPPGWARLADGTPRTTMGSRTATVPEGGSAPEKRFDHATDPVPSMMLAWIRTFPGPRVLRRRLVESRSVSCSVSVSVPAENLNRSRDRFQQQSDTYSFAPSPLHHGLLVPVFSHPIR